MNLFTLDKWAIGADEVQKIASKRGHGLQPGDVVIMSSGVAPPKAGRVSSLGNLFWQKAAPMFQGGLTHAAIVVDDKHVVETRAGEGTTLKPFHEAVADKHYVVRRPPFSERHRQHAASFAKKQIGKPYNWSDFAVQAAGVLMPETATKMMEARLALPRNRDGYSCSSLITAAYGTAHLTHGVNGRAVAPADLRFSGKLKDVTSDGSPVVAPTRGRISRIEGVKAADAPKIKSNVPMVPPTKANVAAMLAAVQTMPEEHRAPALAFVEKIGPAQTFVLLHSIRRWYSGGTMAHGLQRQSEALKETMTGSPAEVGVFRGLRVPSNSPLARLAPGTVVSLPVRNANRPVSSWTTQERVADRFSGKKKGVVGLVVKLKDAEGVTPLVAPPEHSQPWFNALYEAAVGKSFRPTEGEFILHAPSTLVEVVRVKGTPKIADALGGPGPVVEAALSSHLKPDVEFRDHQEDAIRKLMRQNGNIILSHPVGSGKTITALGGFDRLRQAGMASRALIVTPASLRKNFTDEGVHKFTTARAATFGNAQEVATGQGRHISNPDPDATYHVVSYDLFRTNPEAYIKAAGADTVIYDELHKIKNTGITGKALREVRKHHRNFIGLTGSIVSNSPADLVPLVDAMTDGKHHLGTKENFERRFMTEDGKLQNTPVVRVLLNPYIHHVDAATGAGTMPRKTLETVKVDMSPEQQELYQYVVGKMDPVTALKFRFGSSKLKTNDVNNIFNKMTQARQVSNAIHTVNQSVTLSESAQRSPKIKKVLDDVEEHLRTTPDGQVIVYSNMIHGGVDVLSQGLKDRGIEHGLFMGKGQPGSTEQSRSQAVTDYQNKAKRVIVLSSAGGEGLNLGDTTFVANVDGHFNPEKTHQAEARGVRAGGQAHRAEPDRHVLIRRYVTRVPLSKTQVARDTMNLISPNAMVNRAMDGQPLLYNPLKRERSPDEWAYEVAGHKDDRNKQLRGNLDKTADTPLRDNVEDLMDLFEEGLVARAEDQDLEIVKVADAKAKERRLAAHRIPMQPHRLVKTDRVVMDAYMKEFAPHLEEALDPTSIVLPKEQQVREQEFIDALRVYYREAAKNGGGGGSTKAKTDDERKKEVLKQVFAVGTAGVVLGGLQGSVAGLTSGEGIRSSLLMGGATGVGLGGLLSGVTAWDGLRNPVYATSAARAKRMSRLSDEQMTHLLRGLEVQQKEEKLHRLAVGSNARAISVKS